jgi:hypothetical protein
MITDTTTITISYTAPYSTYTYTLSSGQVLTVESVASTGDVIMAGLLLALIGVLVLDITFRVVYRR